MLIAEQHRNIQTNSQPQNKKRETTHFTQLDNGSPLLLPPRHNNTPPIMGGASNTGLGPNYYYSKTVFKRPRRARWTRRALASLHHHQSPRAEPHYIFTVERAVLLQATGPSVASLTTIYSSSTAVAATTEDYDDDNQG